MKKILKILIAGMCIVLLGGAFALAEDETPWLPIATKAPWLPIAIRETPELGDSSMGIITLSSLSGLALAGAVVAHKKAKRSVR